MLFSLLPAAVSILGFVFAVAVWRGKSKYKWAAWNLAYLLFIEFAAILFFYAIENLTSTWLVIILSPGVGCLACVMAMTMQKSIDREAGTARHELIDHDSTVSNELEPSIVYRSVVSWHQLAVFVLFPTKVFFNDDHISVIDNYKSPLRHQLPDNCSSQLIKERHAESYDSAVFHIFKMIRVLHINGELMRVEMDFSP